MDIHDLSNSSIAICDDSITNVMILSKLVESEGIKNIHSFTDPRKVVPFLKERKGDIDLLILDIEMPHMTGFDVMNAIAAEFPSQRNFPILVITGLRDKEVRTHALTVGANDFIGKPFDQLEVVLRVRNLLGVQRALRIQTQLAEQLEREVVKRTDELNKANDLLVYLLALAGEMRDNETGRHVARVGRYSRILAEGIGLPPELCFLIEKAAPLHDIGKIGIPDSILHKNGRLDEAEREIMNSHTTKGLQLLGEYGHDSMLIQMAASIALNHHERWDGTGYPKGMMGESIPVEGRIVAIADVFDALTTRRPYKEPWPLEKTSVFLRENAGKHFDPAVVDIFTAHIEQFARVMHELSDPE
ncbi:MAG: HD domain-containing phosphohydrolase [Candidatus Ferrigenium altingense]|jgi:putative two-component system response regulator